MKFTLFLHELRRNKLSLIIWSAALAFMLSVCVFIYPEMQSQMGDLSAMFSDMGSFTEAFGMDTLNFGEFMGYFGVEVSNTLGLGGALMAGIVGVSALSKEERDGTSELLLTMPVSRAWIVFEKLLSASFHVFVVNAVTFAVSTLSMLAISVEADYGKIALVFLANLIMQLEIMALTFGISAFLTKNAIGIGIGVSFGLYFVSILANLDDSLEFIGKLTPFGYANSGYIIEHGGLDVWPLMIGLVFASLGIALAFFKYTKKDIK